MYDLTNRQNSSWEDEWLSSNMQFQQRKANMASTLGIVVYVTKALHSLYLCVMSSIVVQWLLKTHKWPIVKQADKLIYYPEQEHCS